MGFTGRLLTGDTEAQERQWIAVSGVLHLFQIHRHKINYLRRRIAPGTKRRARFPEPGPRPGAILVRRETKSCPTTTYPFPFRFQHKAVGWILGGWTVNGIGTFRTGEPFTARYGSNRSANGDRWSPDRPNLNPGFSPNPTSGVSAGCASVKAGTPLGTPDLYYDPCAFSRPAAGTWGNLGRNTLNGPGLFDTDFSVDKTFKPTERINMQFRAEIFNLLNQAHFYLPGPNAFSGSAGHITSLVAFPGGRLIQLGVKVLF